MGGGKHHRDLLIDRDGLGGLYISMECRGHGDLR